MEYIGIPITREEWECWTVSFDDLRCPQLFKGKSIDVSVLMKHFFNSYRWYAVAPLLIIGLLRERLSTEALYSLSDDLKELARTSGYQWTFPSSDGLEIDIARGIVNCSITLHSLPDQSVDLDFWVRSWRLIRRYLDLYPAPSDHHSST